MGAHFSYGSVSLHLNHSHLRSVVLAALWDCCSWPLSTSPGGLAIRLAICTGPRTTSPPEPPCGAPCNRCCIDGHTDSGRCPLFVAATSATRGPTMSDVAYATSKNASSFDAHSTGSRRLPECEYLCTRFECLQASVGNLVALVHHVVAKEVDVCLALVELLWREHARENRNT